MKTFYLIFLFLFLLSCNKPKTVLICGNHACVNKAEAKQFFEENLSIEVKIIDKKKEKNIDLVELNLKENENGERNISILSKTTTNKKIVTLSNDDIKQIKKNIKNKKKEKEIAKIINKKNQNNAKIIKKKKNVINQRKNIVDVCTILDKCSIDEISKYLLKQGNKKKFPDITTRQ
jgi:hypothetical protein